MSSSPSGVVTHMPSYVAWENVRALPLIRLVTLVSLMGMISYYHVARMWKYYKIKRTLTIHIAVGLVELFKFSFEDIFRNPIPGVFDFAITLYQSKNALAIIASLRKGDRKWSRPIFHAAVLLRIALSGYSVLAKSTSAYRVSIALDHGFIWDRLMLWGFMRVLPKYSTSYLLAQYLGALVSFETNSVEGGFLPLGGISLVFTVMMVAFRLFDEWNIIDMSMFEEKPQVTTEISAPASVEASVTAASEQTDTVEVSADVSEGPIEPQVEIVQDAGYFTAPRLQLDTRNMDRLNDDLATPTLDSATSSYSDGSMSLVSSMSSPLLTPATPTVFHAPVVDHFSAPSQEDKLRKIQMLNGGDLAFPQPPARAALPAFEEAVLKPMPGGDAEMWQASKQDFAATVNILGQAFCKLAAQSGFTSLDHYETLKKRQFTVNNLEA